MTEEECKDKMEEKSRYSGRVTRDVSWYSSWYSRSIPDSGRSESRTVPSQTVAHNNSEDPVPNFVEYEDRLPPLQPDYEEFPIYHLVGGFEPEVATWPMMVRTCYLDKGIVTSSDISNMELSTSADFQL